MQAENDYLVATTTTDKYYLLEKDVLENLSPNDIKISNNMKKIRPTVTYITSQFGKDDIKSVNIKATGQAISKAVKVAENVKRSVPDLHQQNKIYNIEVTDVYIPEEEGLDEVTITKKISVLEITLYKQVTEEIKKTIGYQPPIDRSKVKSSRPKQNFRPRLMGNTPTEKDSGPQKVMRVRQRARPQHDGENRDHFPRQERGPFRGRGRPERGPHSHQMGQPHGHFRGHPQGHPQPRPFDERDQFQNRGRGGPQGVFRVRGGRPQQPQPEYRPRIQQ